MDLGLLVYLFVYGSNRVDVGSVRYTQVAEGHGPLRREEGTEWLLVKLGCLCYFRSQSCCQTAAG